MAKKTATKTAATKKAAPKKATKKKAATKKSSGNSDITSTMGQVLEFLLKKKATSKANAIENKKVWEHAGGPSVCVKLRDMKLIDRDDREDGSKNLFLTAKGKKEAVKVGK